MRHFVAIVVAIVGYGIWHFMPAYPNWVEQRHIRGFLDFWPILYLNTLLKLERTGVITGTAYHLRNMMNLAGGNNSINAAENENIVVTSELLEDVEVLIFRPRLKRYQSGAIIYFHGGGFVVGDVWTHFQFTQKLAMDADLVVFSVDYPLAPQHPFPAAVDYARKVAVAIFEQAEKFGVDPSAIFLGGDGAGGNLATTVAMEMPNQFVPRGLVLISPWLQMANVLLPSYQLYSTLNVDWFFATYAGLTRYSSEMEKFILTNSHVPVQFQRDVSKYFSISNLPEDLRLNDMIIVRNIAYPIMHRIEASLNAKERLDIENLATNKRAWPLLCDDIDLKKIVSLPIFIQYSRFDSFRDEDILFAHRLRSLGANKVETNYVRGIHGEVVTTSLYPILPETRAGAQAFKDILLFLKRNLALQQKAF